MDYLLKKFPKLPYTVAVVLSLINWGFLCGAFGYFFILSRADFESTGTGQLFIFSFPLFVMIIGMAVVMEYGGFRFFGIKEKRKELRVLNDNISGGHISSNLSTKTLKEVCHSLVMRPMDGFTIGVRVAGIIIFLALLTEWLASGKTTNLPVILASGLISLVLLMVFANFFAQRFIFSTLQECRILLAQRGEKIKEPQLRFNTLKAKFNFFLLVPIIVVLTVLSIINVVNLNIIVLSLIGLAMSIMISRVLSFSIYEAFLGIKSFAKELPSGKKTLFSTGSLDIEVVELSEALNKAGREVYISRNKVEKTKQELKKRVEELEKWYKLTVGRELKMAELKKEIKQLKEELEKYRNKKYV